MALPPPAEHDPALSELHRRDGVRTPDAADHPRRSDVHDVAGADLHRGHTEAGNPLGVDRQAPDCSAVDLTVAKRRHPVDGPGIRRDLHLLASVVTQGDRPDTVGGSVREFRDGHTLTFFLIAHLNGVICILLHFIQ